MGKRGKERGTPRILFPHRLEKGGGKEAAKEEQRIAVLTRKKSLEGQKRTQVKERSTIRTRPDFQKRGAGKGWTGTLRRKEDGHANTEKRQRGPPTIKRERGDMTSWKRRRARRKKRSEPGGGGKPQKNCGKGRRVPDEGTFPKLRTVIYQRKGSSRLSSAAVEKKKGLWSTNKEEGKGKIKQKTN